MSIQLQEFSSVIRLIIRMNVSDTWKFDQTKGACQSWSCSINLCAQIHLGVCRRDCAPPDESPVINE